MTTFDKREKAAEDKYAYDEEVHFKAVARRNRHLGMWAAGLMGKSGDEAVAYARSVIAADFEEAGEEDVFRKVRKDFDAAGVAQSDDAIRHMMVTLLAQATEEIRTGQ